ncbi:class I SAM-dependent methyltransferase [Bacillus sp. T33-2]|uniref:class I SAM-dependent methyltransferase n=1 Tax=Bacillus sp. T33-2 TaxID=2054168 RepID=UPI000C76D0EC|nr:class I SAM-dependent methyltransferase [Bacillus sp. T33-2]PLR89775.1 class I SAM-dependent methyltransferase [Bacillus sp. T33-2]
MEKQKQKSIFDKQANQYERKREGLAQIQWRKELLSHAKGEVLELAVGAGANFAFYPPDVRITAADFSRAMLEKAERAAKDKHIQVDFICSDIEKMDFPGQSYDTIVSTLSLCSYDQPFMVLDKINKWCKPAGRILLMEHGISSNPVISIIQRALDPILFRLNGCHHNRNIVELVQKSGMVIEAADSHWMNMVHLIRAKPKQ